MEIRAILTRYSAKDSRIKVVFRAENGHISAASNSALELVTGEWVGLLDHDDLLSSDALFSVAEIINLNPAANLIYSDEDKIDSGGVRSLPFFKPDWSPHLAISQAYIGHFACYSTDILKKIGGFDIKLSGAQDYDLWLRASLISQEIIHIPKILYHWRMHPQSTAASGAAKPYAHEAGRLAIEKYLSSKYKYSLINAVDGVHSFTYGAKFNLVKSDVVSIIIPTRDKIELLRDCIDSIFEKSSWLNYEIIVVNNGSMADESNQYFQEIQSKTKNVKVVDADIPFNWSRLNNIGASAASGNYYIFLNNDTKVISESWMESLVGYASLPDVGVVGALLLFEDGTIQHSGVVVGMGGWADHVFRTMKPMHSGGGPFISPVLTRNVLAVTGACLAISRQRFDELGKFDEEFVICGSDVELGLRAYKKGYFNVMCAEARLLHYESKTRTPHVPDCDFIQSNIKYAPYRLEKIDPFFSPNLSMDVTFPKIKHS